MYLNSAPLKFYCRGSYGKARSYFKPRLAQRYDLSAEGIYQIKI